MLGTIKRIWKTAGALGVHDQSAHERRHITTLNHALLLGVVVSVGYLGLYLAIGSVMAAAINGVFIAMYSFSMYLNHADHQKLARHVAILSANAHIFALSVAVLGEASGVHRWFWMFIVLVFLIFTRAEKVAIYVYALLSIGLFTLIEHDVVSFSHDPVVSDDVAQVISVVSSIVTLLIITAVVDLFDRETSAAEKALSKEHERSESLLLNVLPKCIASRLKDDQREPIADNFREVTVLFADIAGFTSMSESLDPQHIVELLNKVFSEFDQLAEKHGLEKIKTIGDAYMVAGGLPVPMERHAHAVAQMALDMAEVTHSYKKPDGGTLDIRIGINTGPVVAGVIGVKKFIYDLWGDTVNTASRMESTGLIGAIQVSEATYEIIKDEFDVQPRGTIEVKGKGRLPTYILNGPKRAGDEPRARAAG